MGFLTAKAEVAVRTAGVTSVQLVVAEITTEAERVVAHGFAGVIAHSVVRIRLVEIEPVITDREAVEEQRRHRGRVTARASIDKAAVGRIRIKPVLRIRGDGRTCRRIRCMDSRAEEGDARNVYRGGAYRLGIAGGEQLVARRNRDWKARQILLTEILLVVDRIHRGRVIVVIVERPIAGLVVHEVDALRHVRVDDGTLVARIVIVESVWLIRLGNERKRQFRDGIDIGRDVVTGNRVAIRVGRHHGIAELVVHGRSTPRGLTNAPGTMDGATAAGHQSRRSR